MLMQAVSAGMLSRNACPLVVLRCLLLVPRLRARQRSPSQRLPRLPRLLIPPRNLAAKRRRRLRRLRRLSPMVKVKIALVRVRNRLMRLRRIVVRKLLRTILPK
jgi:hypothetical protein